MRRAREGKSAILGQAAKGFQRGIDRSTQYPNADSCIERDLPFC